MRLADARRDQHDIARDTPACQGHLERGARGDGGGDAGHHFHFDARGLQGVDFFLGATEEHRVPALQAHDESAFAGGIGQLLVDEALRRGVAAAALADGHAPGALR